MIEALEGVVEANLEIFEVIDVLLVSLFENDRVDVECRTAE